MIDPGAFPHAAEVYWSSTPDTTGAYGADFFLAQAIPYYRYSKAAVRLVRDAR
jgi:hypothetical protein